MLIIIWQPCFSVLKYQFSFPSSDLDLLFKAGAAFQVDLQSERILDIADAAGDTSKAMTSTDKGLAADMAAAAAAKMKVSNHVGPGGDAAAEEEDAAWRAFNPLREHYLDQSNRYLNVPEEQQPSYRARRALDGDDDDDLVVVR